MLQESLAIGIMSTYIVQTIICADEIAILLERHDPCVYTSETLNKESVSSSG